MRSILNLPFEQHEWVRPFYPLADMSTRHRRREAANELPQGQAVKKSPNNPTGRAQCQQMAKENTMLRHRSTLVLVAVCTAVAACSQVQNKEDMLAAAGFTIVPANTPQRQASLRSMPPHKFVHQVRNNAVIFTYADPTICDCMYV